MDYFWSLICSNFSMAARMVRCNCLFLFSILISSALAYWTKFLRPCSDSGSSGMAVTYLFLGLLCLPTWFWFYLSSFWHNTFLLFKCSCMILSTDVAFIASTPYSLMASLIVSARYLLRSDCHHVDLSLPFSDFMVVNKMLYHE